MNFYRIFYFIVFFCTALVKNVESNRISKKIYVDLQSNFTCFRRMNTTHQIGCSSDIQGNVGIIQILSQLSDVDHLVESASNSPYVAVFVTPSLFNTKNMLRLKKSGKVNGIIVAASSNLTKDYPQGFATEQSCPNNKIGLYSSSKNEEYGNCKQGSWLPQNPGLNMLYEDWPFPMFLMTDANDLKNIQECYDKYNKPTDSQIKQYPQCAAQLSARMSAAKDTLTCMRRSTHVTNINPMVICDSLGDKNLYTMLYDSADYNPKSVIVVMAKLDSSSVFYGLTPGVDSAVSGTVTLLAVSQALAKVRDQFMKLSNNQTNVMFVLFNGESFGYIGSSRMVYDMAEGKFKDKLNLNHISHVIELNQIISEDHQYWAHTDPLSLNTTATTVEDMFEKFSKHATTAGISIKRTDKKRALPPSSVQSFLSEDLKIPALVLTNFDEKYLNKYSPGIYDNGESVNYDPQDLSVADRISKVASVVASVVFQLATNHSVPIDVKPEMVNDMLYCYVKSASCDLFKEAMPPSLVSILANMPYSLYVGVSSITNEATIVTSYLMHYLTGSEVDDVSKEDQCHGDDDYRYVWIAGSNNQTKGVCYKSLVKNHTALSPAFIDNDWSSTKYSTWTESRWKTFNVRIFLKASDNQQIITLVCGIIVFLLSLVLVYLIDSRADILFASPSTSTANIAPTPC